MKKGRYEYKHCTDSHHTRGIKFIVSIFDNILYVGTSLLLRLQQNEPPINTEPDAERNALDATTTKLIEDIRKLHSTTQDYVPKVEEMEKRLQVSSTLILKKSLATLDAELRDAAISHGAAYCEEIKSNMDTLAERKSFLQDKFAWQELDAFAYDNVVFLLKTSCKLILSSQNKEYDFISRAAEFGPDFLILFIDYCKEQQIKWDPVHVLYDHLEKYMHDHSIDSILDRVSPEDRLTIYQCAETHSKLNMTSELDVLVAMGDEKEITARLEKMDFNNPKDMEEGCYAMKMACRFNRINAVKLLIGAGVDVNCRIANKTYMAGTILSEAVKGGHAAIVELLLSCRKIDIAIRNVTTDGKTLYTLGLDCASTVINDLFREKKKRIDYKIDACIVKIKSLIADQKNKANSLWFIDLGHGKKAAAITAALERVTEQKAHIFSVDEFLNWSASKQEDSLWQAMEKDRIFPIHNTVSAMKNFYEEINGDNFEASLDIDNFTLVSSSPVAANTQGSSLKK